MQNGEIFTGVWSRRAVRLSLAIFGLILAVLYDLIFWNSENGIGLIIFVIIYLVGLFSFLIATNSIRQKKFLFLLIPLLVLSSDAFFYNNFVVTNIVPWVVFGLLVLMSLLLTVKNDEGHRFSFLSIPIIHKIFWPIIQKIRSVSADLNSGEDRSVVYKKILTGLIIAIPLISIFLALFVSADSVFSDWLFKAPESLDISYIWRVFRVLVLAILASGFFYEIFSLTHKHNLRNVIVEKFDPVVITTVLIVLNLLFLLFVVFQFKYLFGSYEYVINNNLIFSVYAKKGFGELIFASCLVLLIFVIVYRSFSHNGHSKKVNILSSLLMLLTTVIAVSAWRRLDLYQQAYGLTSLRLYSIWLVYFIIVLLVVSAVFSLARWQFKHYIHSAFILGLVSFTIVASLNVDYTIAKENLERFPTSDSRWDLPYITSRLSTDALPAIEEYTRLDPVFDSKLVGDIVGLNLSFQAKEKELGAHDKFVEFNWGVYKSKEAMAKIQIRFNDIFERAQQKQKDEQAAAQERENTVRQTYLQQENFNDARNKIFLQKVIGCVYGNKPVPIPANFCVGLNLNNKMAGLVAYDGIISSLALYRVSSTKTPNVFSFQKIGLVIPQNLKNYFNYPERYLLKDGRFVVLDSNSYTYKVFKIIETNGKYTFSESSSNL